jgi:hypothetical protein
MKLGLLSLKLRDQVVGGLNGLGIDDVDLDPPVAGNRRVYLDAPVTHSGPALARGCCHYS